MFTIVLLLFKLQDSCRLSPNQFTPVHSRVLTSKNSVLGDLSVKDLQSSRKQSVEEHTEFE